MTGSIDLTGELPGLIYEKKDHITYITLNRPERGNALHASMIEPLRAIWAEVRDDPWIRATVVTGAGERHFCTGADVGAVASRGGVSAGKGPMSDEVHWSPRQNRVWKPTVTAVNGMAAGGGLHFIVDADIIVAAEHATFLDTHVNVGMVGAIENIGLVKRLPLGTALRMTLVGRDYRLSAQRAHTLGLVDEVVPKEELLSTADGIARQIAANSPAAVTLSMQALWGSLEMGYTQAMEYGWALARLHWDHPDFKEGPRAFAEKRAAQWYEPPETPTGTDGRRPAGTNPLLSEEEEAFRLEVVELLQEHRDVDAFFHREGEHDAAVRRLYAALGERGWLSLAWPGRYGGSEKPPVYEYLLWDEMAYARAARPPLAAGIVAKTIISNGTDEQRERYLPGIRAGTLFFSLGYSEPEAGSDLASVRTTAVREGDEYVLNGEKRWTSGGHRADFLWMLCRTGTLDSHSRGLTLLIVDRRSPGISISPIPAIDGERFNEVRFDSVRVPVANRVGEENGAWPMMIESLATERHVQFCPKRLQRDFEELVAFVRDSGLASDPLVRQRVADLAVSVAECNALAYGMLAAVQAGRSAVVEAAYNKLAGSEAVQQVARAALDLGAPEALVRGTMIEFLWRQSLCETIGGGTSEMMKGIIARTRLGLGGRR